MIAKTITNGIDNLSSWSDLTDALHAGKIDGASELIELAKAGLTLDDIAVTQGFGTVLARSEELWEDSLCCGLISGPM